MTELNHDHPWPGPDSFRTEDAAFFRGRDTEIKQLSQMVRRTQSVVLFGASGLGKTSLIHAGIIPRLAGDEYFAVPLRICYGPGALAVSEQIQAEITEVRRSCGMPALRPQRTVWELLHLRDEPIEGAQPVLIFDQFEELFTIGAGTPQAGQLVEELQALIESVPPGSVRDRLERSPEEARTFSFQRKDHRVVLSIREDLLYGLESLRPQLPSIIHNRYRIGPLSGAMAMEVVLQRPATSRDGPREQSRATIVEPEVAELIVRMVSSDASSKLTVDKLDVEPALLSILCAELARRRPRGEPITRELVTGSRVDIISSFYQRALHDVPVAVQAYIEDELVTTTGFRTCALVAEAQAIPGFSDDVVATLVTRRLLHVIDRQNNKWLELTHDILTAAAVRNRARRHDRQREEAAHEQERRARDQRELRRTRIASAILLVLVVVATGASAVAYTARQEKEKTLTALQRNQQIRQAALSPSAPDYGAQLEKLLSELSPAADIQFGAKADELGPNSQGQEIYDFALYPRRETLPADVAFITYLADHPTFETTLMIAGRDRRFRVGYTGWGCLTRIVAVVEFTTPTKPPAVTQFDMCKALGWR